MNLQRLHLLSNWEFNNGVIIVHTRIQWRVPAAALLLLPKMKLLHQKTIVTEETGVLNLLGIVGTHHLLDPVIVMAEEISSEILVHGE